MSRLQRSSIYVAVIHGRCPLAITSHAFSVKTGAAKLRVFIGFLHSTLGMEAHSD